MARLAEYRDVTDATRSVRTLLDAVWSPRHHATVRLESQSAGWTPAGAVARWTDSGYGVRWQAPDGAWHGRRFLTESAARDHYTAITRSNAGGDVRP